MKTKKQKREVRLDGRVQCHGTKDSCIRLFEAGHHRGLGKKTKKGTKPIKKQKKNYKRV